MYAGEQTDPAIGTGLSIEQQIPQRDLYVQSAHQFGQDRKVTPARMSSRTSGRNSRRQAASSASAGGGTGRVGSFMMADVTLSDTALS